MLYRCRDVIVDICHKMEIGMADYAHHAVISGEISLPTIEDYDLYCHYVAGLVGEGLSRLFSATGKEAPWLADELELSNSMGILLQKTNIIRDFREDADDKRFFWPREIWADAKYGNGVPAQVITQLHAPGEEDRAAWVQSAMIIDALRHAPDSLDYLRLLRNQTVFRFAAIPAVMAMATLELCFMNPEMFQRNIKIRKAQAARLIMKCSNPRDVAYIFVDYARAIHAKASPKDPSFIKLSVACGKVSLPYPNFCTSIPYAKASCRSSNGQNITTPPSFKSSKVNPAQRQSSTPKTRVHSSGKPSTPQRAKTPHVSHANRPLRSSTSTGASARSVLRGARFRRLRLVPGTERRIYGRWRCSWGALSCLCWALRLRLCLGCCICSRLSSRGEEGGIRYDSYYIIYYSGKSSSCFA